jgi:hypothetical protein
MGYRREHLIGRELAIAVARVDTHTNVIPDNAAFAFRAGGVYARLTNFLFQAGLSPRSAVPGLSPDIPILIGYAMRPLYTCAPDSLPTDATCASDNFTFEYDPLIVPTRVGDHARLALQHLRLGALQMLTIPGEMVRA